jgi:hypothetical protein
MRYEWEVEVVCVFLQLKLILLVICANATE